MFFYLKWFIKKRISASGLISNEFEEIRKEVVKLIGEINHITDRDSQLVEERITRLNAILEDTDKRIAVYVKELEKSRSGEALYTKLGQGIRSALKTEPAPMPTLMPMPINIMSSIAPPVEEKKPQRDEAEKPPSKKQIRAQIDILANEGRPPEEIASNLGISVAEVNLAMNLRRK
jgi:hypothetical protein